MTGTTAAGFAEQFRGVPVVPAEQLRFTLLLYPLTAKIVPLKTAVCPAKAISGLFETLS
jgi:hypothetical protein